MGEAYAGHVDVQLVHSLLQQVDSCVCYAGVHHHPAVPCMLIGGAAGHEFTSRLVLGVCPECIPLLQSMCTHHRPCQVHRQAW